MKPTITIERLSEPPREWYAFMEANDNRVEHDYQCHGHTERFGPLRATRKQAKRDGKRLREWWKRRPR